MRSSETIRTLWQHLRAIRGRLRRERAALALLALITIGLGEPLLCIVHCQVWLPIALHSYFSAQHSHAHQHDHAHMAAMVADQHAAGQIDAVQLPATGESAASACAMLGGMGQGSAPPHVPPSPIHDALPARLLVLFVAIFVGARPAAPPGDPPLIFSMPLLRPPILALA